MPKTLIAVVWFVAMVLLGAWCQARGLNPLAWLLGLLVAVIPMSLAMAAFAWLTTPIRNP